MLEKIWRKLLKSFNNNKQEKNNSSISQSDSENKEFPEDIFFKNKWEKLKGRKSDPLNERQKKFVVEYLKDHHVEKAAIRAGYSKRTANANGTILLSLAKINNAIKKERNRSINK
ncbi:terminase small subunit [Orenia marismortui]|uniref:Terminase small subunit n=1 Tax=Orenia marismortui TaxID=46469 RepID=A0A4R8GSH8_9FIRM|nr:terminase small subunit [Orenia marismortui]TDX48906.1 terminase small subunit [Orenia marismortui]